MKYGNRLRELRARHRISQLDLAEKVGCTQWRIWNLENGRQAATETEQKKIARALKVTPAEAFEYAEAAAS